MDSDRYFIGGSMNGLDDRDMLLDAIIAGVPFTTRFNNWGIWEKITFRTDCVETETFCNDEEERKVLGLASDGRHVYRNENLGTFLDAMRKSLTEKTIEWCTPEGESCRDPKGAKTVVGMEKVKKAIAALEARSRP